MEHTKIKCDDMTGQKDGGFGKTGNVTYIGPDNPASVTVPPGVDGGYRVQFIGAVGGGGGGIYAGGGNGGNGCSLGLLTAIATDAEGLDETEYQLQCMGLNSRARQYKPWNLPWDNPASTKHEKYQKACNRIFLVVMALLMNISFFNSAIHLDDSLMTLIGGIIVGWIALIIGVNVIFPMLKVFCEIGHYLFTGFWNWIKGE